MVKASQGEGPKELHRRILLEAASRAGLDGTDEQSQFVEQFASGLEYTSAAADPSPQDNTEVKSADIRNEYFNYKLKPGELNALRELQTAYRARGGKLHEGKTYDYSAEGRFLTAAEKQNGKSGVTAEQYERWKMRDLYEKAQISTSSIFGMPSKLRDLKHVVLNSPEGGGQIDADRALRLYVRERYGDRLLADSRDELVSVAKSRGIKVENLGTKNSKIEFDISVENLLKLHHVYIGVQAKVNAELDTAQKTIDGLAHNRFAKGVIEGAWADLKDNWKIISSPIETVKDLYDAAKTIGNIGLKLAQMKPEERGKLFSDLAKAGIKGLAEMPIGDAAQHLGNFVGRLAVEVALGKSVGLTFKALSATKYGAELLQEAVKISKGIKETVGSIPIPTNASIKVVTDTLGNKMIFPDVELTKLEDLIKPLESRAQQTLSGIKKAINLPAWNKLSFKLEPDGSIHFISAHTKMGKLFQQSMKAGGKKDMFPEWMTEKQIINAIKEAYNSAKKVGMQNIEGEQIVELVGYSNNGMKIRMYVNVSGKQLDTAFPQ